MPMATDDPIRASDSDRETVVAALRDAYTAGRLTLDEFDERMTAAYAGKTWGDLRRLTADLPVQPILGSDVPGRPLPPLPPLLPMPRPPHPPVSPERRRSPVAILIPIAVWTLIALHGGAAHGVAVLVVTMLVVTLFIGALRRR